MKSFPGFHQPKRDQNGISKAAIRPHVPETGLLGQIQADPAKTDCRAPMRIMLYSAATKLYQRTESATT